MSECLNVHNTLQVSGQTYSIHDLNLLEKQLACRLDVLPYSIRILLENMARHCDGRTVSAESIAELAAWEPRAIQREAIPFTPGRVVLQDFTGVPAVVDLATMRSYVARLGFDPQKINPVVPVDLVIDHSVQVDFAGLPEAYQKNIEKEFERNHERYQFLKWGQSAFQNFKVVPPATGIIHQVNLEYLTDVVSVRKWDNGIVAFPDTLVGTDSHTTMINGIGVVGWGVGGIEAISAMLGQPIDVLTPDVIGFKLTGSLPEGTTPTDLTLTITQALRANGVVGKFVEFFGSGLSSLNLADRAMISNMSPENGATITYFPVDEQTLAYLRFTGRAPEVVARVEAYCKHQRLFRDNSAPDPQFTKVIELDLSTVEPSLAGPKRPHDRVPLSQVKQSFETSFVKPKAERGFARQPDEMQRVVDVRVGNKTWKLTHGSVIIAAITSCTNTSNPFVMVTAGLLAQNAVKRGLSVPAYVKTSLAPGSRVVTEYLRHSGLQASLDALGFNLIGYGCATCIGNSGPIAPEIAEAIVQNDLVAAAVLSGNRNFEGRIHPQAQANYLASPPLVVAYALAGNIHTDLVRDPIGFDLHGKPVYLKEIWPSSQQVQEVIASHLTSNLFQSSYADLYQANPEWNDLEGVSGALYPWNTQSTYLQEPPFFEGLSTEKAISDILNARVLALFGDSITTDHISPAGSIPVKSPAGKYLTEHGVSPQDFNSYGSRRGNHEVMMRGTFANIRLKNMLLNNVEGGYTTYFPTGEQTSIYDAAMRYQSDSTPLIILAGKEYGSGSSRDWAAKGTALLGVRAVIAESYERIHRSNLVGMGVLPLQFKPGENAQSLNLSGTEQFSIRNLAQQLGVGGEITVDVISENGTTRSISVLCRLDTPFDFDTFQAGGILQLFLKNTFNLG